MSAWLKTYFGKSLLLIVCGVLLLGLVWKKRVSQTAVLWRSQVELADGVDKGAPEMELVAEQRAELNQLNTQLGDLSLPADVVWQQVITRISQANDAGKLELHRLDSELIEPAAENVLHVLPITVSGTFPKLLRLANELQRSVPEAHAISIRFYVERGSYTMPRTLLMTVYLQKIDHHA